tara:strand:- start:4186 stop:4965 length:780 start_codon:yes stop_codon:yes gene_type:complete
MEEKKEHDAHKTHHTVHHKKPMFSRNIMILFGIGVLLLLFNQWQISSLNTMLTYGLPSGASGGSNSGSSTLSLSGGKSLDDVNVEDIKSTAQGIAALFELDQIKNTDDAIKLMIPTGTPEYGEAMGVTFDDPVTSLNNLARVYPALKQQVQGDNPEAFERFAHLASTPKGISCEYCCGIGPIGADAKGNSRCGCKHNPGVLTLALWLVANTEYNDAEVLREVYKWKTLWFPKNMVTLATQIAGGDDSVLRDLPGMVGGC